MRGALTSHVGIKTLSFCAVSPAFHCSHSLVHTHLNSLLLSATLIITMAHQTTFSPPVVAQLRAHCADVACTGFYLADARVRRNVIWKCPKGTKGCLHILVQKKANTLACDDIPIDPAYLILGCHIFDDSFYMTSDTNSSSFAPSLADAKASCLLSMPLDFLKLQVFRADWEEAMGNLCWLQSQVLTKGFNESLGVLIYAKKTDDKVMIKIKHKLFVSSLFSFIIIDILYSHIL